MRTLGVAVIGLFGGLLAGLLLTEADARLMVALGIAGAVVALVIDRKRGEKP